MSYISRSEEGLPSRLSTPEPNLDDHRFQAESLPPPPDGYHRARRPTHASLVEERPELRYAIPEPDLDDRQFQNEGVPFAQENLLGSRRGTLTSLAGQDRPGLDHLRAPSAHEEYPGTRRSTFAGVTTQNVPQFGHLNVPSSPEGHYGAQRGLQRSNVSQDGPRTDLSNVSPMEHPGPTARDFENAIIDDNKSTKSQMSTKSQKSLTADEEWHRERRTSLAPVVARHNTFRRSGRDKQRETGRTSQNSSRANSTTPPNSVDAFAPVKTRERAGTVNSRNRSTENVALDRTVSNTTHPRRRGTFGEESAGGHRPDLISLRSSVEEDVCFPPEEPKNTYTIDFEDLEEFVAQNHPKTPLLHPFMPHFAKHNEQTQCHPQILRRTEIGASASSGGPGYFEPESSGQIEMDEKQEEVNSSEDRPRGINGLAEIQNRFTFFSSEIEETIHAPELGGLVMPGETFRDLFELGPEGGVWWLDMLNPSEEEVFAICGAFRVHPLTREDITTQETREKVELFRSYYFLCFRSFYAVDKTSEDYLEPINVYAVVFREGLLTFSFCPNPHAAHVRKRISRLRDYVNLSADWICYALIDEIVDEFAPVLREVEREADTIEDSVFTARLEDYRAILRQIGECRKTVVSLLRLLGSKADVIKGFAKKCNESYSVAPRGDVGLYLSDVQDHIVTMMSNLGHFEKMLGRSHSNHLSQISLNHIEQGSRGNALLSKITVFATILVPLNLIAGLFGMNVTVPGENTGELYWWFGIVGVILGISTICVVLARRYRFV